MAMPAERAFANIYSAIYEGADEMTDEQIDDLSARYRHFEISDGGFDYYDGWKVYLIEEGLVGRLIWRGPDMIVHETRIGAGEFDRVLDGFIGALEATSGRTRPIPAKPR